MKRKIYITPVTEEIITSYQESLLVNNSPANQNADDPRGLDNGGGNQELEDNQAKRHNIWDEGGVEDFPSIWK